MRSARCLAAVLTLVASCIYDPDRPCGAHQRHEDGECICDPGYRQNEYLTACVACGLNEVGSGRSCQCMAGYSRSSTTNVCEPNSPALGLPCDGTCSDPVYAYCYAPPSGSAYCTNTGCTSSAECGGGYGCDTERTPRVCSKLPSGVGHPCTSDDDCAQFEAKHCETYLLKTCLVRDCAAAEVSCYPGTVCCDYSLAFLPLSLCLQVENLDNGACPVNGVIVME